MKRGRRKGGSKDKVFGCDLIDHLSATHQDVPQVLRSCSDFIEVHGIVDGIYRLSGVSSNTQKLRSEFDNEGNPDLSKDVYLQDIHCVSSLCKAYFRELPNPLLTYQLYDHFAEAVAVQLEDERLVKIKDVLKDLPPPHYRTLEYLMRHLVRMSTYSNETNMHIRNLAIVWAPNLLRSKDIEASGFNGTAAFMEVRVQSIVVEFILNHVSQLFPEADSECGTMTERRKSLPSPSLLQGADENFFKAIPFQYPGNMSPGDGPPPMRPYHSIIDGTDKRKGSLKNRKWKSIFNLGGRLHDPRKKNKYTPKDKENNALRPAKSMDSLSSGPYTQEEDGRAGEKARTEERRNITASERDIQGHTTQLSPLVTTSANTESVSTGISSGTSGYAVTYRRTGGASVSVVSGGSGAQGTYRSFDPGVVANADKTQVATPSRAERRAGMHISVPFSVTVPLHITSGLAMGVLHGGRGEDEQPTASVSDEEQLKKVKKESSEEKEAEGEQDDGETGSLCDSDKGNMDITNKEEENKEVKKEETVKVEPEEREKPEDESIEDVHLSKEDDSDKTQDRTQDADSPTEADERDEDYMIMRPAEFSSLPEVVSQNEDLPPQPQEEVYPDQELPLDFQDTFGFLDLMDNFASNQINEFSVEPPAFEEEEEEEEEEDTQSPSFSLPAGSSPNHLAMETLNLDLPTNPHRLVPGKSHSLPYKSYSFQPAMSSSSSSENFIAEDDSISEKSDYEDMFYKSLPSDSHFQGLNWSSSPSNSLSAPDQSECINQTPATIDLPGDISDLPSSDQPEVLANQLHTEIIESNEAADCAIEQHLSKVDINPLLVITEHLNSDDTEDKTNIDDSTEDRRETGSNEGEDIKEPLMEENKEQEDTDSKNETHTFGQEETISIQIEIQEDTDCSLDPTSMDLEPSIIETHCMIEIEPPPYLEEYASVDGQSENPESDINAADSEVTGIDATDSVLVVTQDSDELSSLLPEHTDISESVVVLGETGEEGNIKIEAVNELKEENCESEHSEGKEIVDALMHETNVIEVESNTDVVIQDVETSADSTEEDGDEMTVEKQQDDVSAGEESNQEMKNDGDIEEMKTENDTEDQHELKEGYVLEEVNEGEDEPPDSDKIHLEEEEGKEHEAQPEAPSSSRMKELGPGRMVIISKNSLRVYQVKTVPVVPPKPQHSRITAFKQQFQQWDTEKLQMNENEPEHQEHKETEESDALQNHDHQSTQQGNGVCREGMEDNKAENEKKQLRDHLEGEEKKESDDHKQRRDTWDGASPKKETKRDLDKEIKRSSGVSICFDEAVARATGKRCKEKESVEKDRFIDLHWEKGEHKEGLHQIKREEDDKN